MSLRPICLPPDRSVASRPAPTTGPPEHRFAVAEKHLHPAPVGHARRRRIAQAAGHPGIPYH